MISVIYPYLRISKLLKGRFLIITNKISFIDTCDKWKWIYLNPMKHLMVEIYNAKINADFSMTEKRICICIMLNLNSSLLFLNLTCICPPCKQKGDKYDIRRKSGSFTYIWIWGKYIRKIGLQRRVEWMDLWRTCGHQNKGTRGMPSLNSTVQMHLWHTSMLFFFSNIY